MRWIAVLVALAALSSAAVVGAEEDPKKKEKPPPPPVGIWWAPDFQAGLKQAMLEGRPVLLCVNALENERANNVLAGSTYRSAPWGTATRGYVAFVCNPNDHKGGKGGCSRYEQHNCACHKEALTWFLGRFGPNLISPQHVILEPDGDVAYRKEYYEGVVTPALLEGYLSKVAPRIAYSRAGIGREKKMKSFGTLDLDGVDAFARTWLDGSDGLAAAAILNVLDDCYESARRLAIIASLQHTHDLQVPVLMHAAEERVLYPTDEPKETIAWVKALFAADREAGVWAATRALVRLADVAERNKVLRLWAGRTDGDVPGIADLPEKERPRAFEALILAKDERGRVSKPPADWTLYHEEQIARARGVAGYTTPSKINLAAELKTPRRGPLRRALLRADVAQIRKHDETIIKGIASWKSEPLRIAGALALMRTKDAHGAVILPVLLQAVGDPVEGPPTKRELRPILGDEAGSEGEVSLAIWQKRLRAALGGGK